MGPAYMFSRGVETLRIDGYLTLILLTRGTEYISSTDETWGTPVNEEGPPESSVLLEGPPES